MKDRTELLKNPKIAIKILTCNLFKNYKITNKYMYLDINKCLCSYTG